MISRQSALIFLLLATSGVAVGLTAVAQEEEAPVPDPVAEAAEATEEAAEDAAGSTSPADADDGVLDEAFDDESLDEQTYEGDDDDFVPTEEIPVDEPIPFPSNI